MPAGPGQIRLDQVAISPAAIAVWTEIVAAGSYDHYNIAVVDGQPDPILITCPRPETDHLGPGCAGGVYWFASPRLR